MKEITDKLAAPISEEDQVSYATLVTVLEARVDDVQLSHVQQALIHEEQKLHSYNHRVPHRMKVSQLQHCLEDREKPKLIK